MFALAVVAVCLFIMLNWVLARLGWRPWVFCILRCCCYLRSLRACISLLSSTFGAYILYLLKASKSLSLLWPLRRELWKRESLLAKTSVSLSVLKTELLFSRSLPGEFSSSDWITSSPIPYESNCFSSSSYDSFWIFSKLLWKSSWWFLLFADSYTFSSTTLPTMRVLFNPASYECRVPSFCL